MSKHRRLLRYRRVPCYLFSRCCVWFPFNFQVSSQEVRTLSKIPGFTPISQQAFHIRLSHPQAIVSEYVQVWRLSNSLRGILANTRDFLAHLSWRYLRSKALPSRTVNISYLDIHSQSEKHLMCLTV